MNKQKILFFLGKGGVGKSTTSTLTAIEDSLGGEKVLLASMDPAHNLGDLFEREITQEPVKINENLFVSEISLDYWVEEYLKDVERQLAKSYAYLTALSLEKSFEIIRYSPGIEEYALLRAFKFYINKYKSFDKIIFDMPPTGLTLKFLSLPKLSQVWLEKLVDLRNEIIKKKEIITRIHFGNITIERDELLNKLNSQLNEYDEIRKIIEDPERTELVLVLNQDKLSFAESNLIIDKLKVAELKVKKVYVNKYVSTISNESIEEAFGEYEIKVFPQNSSPITGYDNLVGYLQKNGFIKQ
jgi:arsenite-transporting ATPase